jgi:hypothetical protein
MSYEIVDASGEYYSDEMSYNYADNLDEIQDQPVETSDAEEYINDSDSEVDDTDDFDVDELDEEDVEEIDPYDPDFFKEPDTFDSEEERLDWYRDRVETVKSLLDTDSDVYKSFAIEKQQQLVERMESEFEGFGIMHEALQTDARGFLLQFIPEALAEHGINPIMNETELLERVESDLQKEYGDDYRMRLNQTEIFNPRSFTAQVWAKQQSLIREWDTINARNREILTKWNDTIANKPAVQQQQQATMTQQDLDSVYNSHFKDKYDRQTYDKMMSDSMQKKFTYDDLEKVMRFEQFMEDAYQRGLREAQTKGRQVFDNASREGTVIRAQDNRVANQRSSADMITNDFESFFNGGIPHY